MTTSILFTSLGWALLHFLWQGALIALVLKAALVALRRDSAQGRYLAACAALVLLVMAPVATVCWLDHAQLVSDSRPLTLSEQSRIEPPPVAFQRVERLVLASRPEQRSAPAVLVKDWLEARLSWLVLAWGSGVVLLGLRMAVGCWRVNRLRRQAQPLPESGLEERASEVARRLGVIWSVRYLQSVLVEVPSALGWLRPVVLLPAGCLTGLTPDQLEAILAHELAHIRRGDYLVNLVQSVVETLLFYHPAVWWVSRQIRTEREHCCDDWVIAVCGDRIGYARALASLEERRSATGQWALAAAGGPLLERIRRLMGKPAESRFGGGWLIAILILAALAIPILGGRTGLLAQTTPQVPAQPAGPSQPRVQQRPPPSEPRVSEARSLDSGSRLFTRLYRLDSGQFSLAVQTLEHKSEVRHLSNWEMQPSASDVVDFFLEAGADFRARPEDLDPSGTPKQSAKALHYDHGTGELLVRATPEDFEKIETALRTAGVATRSKATTQEKLAQLLIPAVSFEQATLEKVILELTIMTRLVDPERKGVNFEIDPQVPASAPDQPIAQPQAARAAKLDPKQTRITLHRENLRLADLVEAIAQAAEPRLQYLVNPNAVVFFSNSALVHGARWLIEMGELDKAEANLRKAVRRDPEDRNAFYYLAVIDEARYAEESRKREIADAAKQPPWTPSMVTNLANTSPGRQRIYQKLDKIILSEVDYVDLSLREVVRDLNEQARKRDPGGQGINFIINPRVAVPVQTQAVDSPTLRPLAASAQVEQPGMVDARVRLHLSNVRLVDVVDAVAKVAESPTPIKYSIEDYAVVFSPRGPELPQLFTRIFKINPDPVNPAWRSQEPNLTYLEALGSYFRRAGVDFGTNIAGWIGGGVPGFAPGGSLGAPSSPARKALFFNDRTGMLLVRATLEDLDIVEKAVSLLNSEPPQLFTRSFKLSPAAIIRALQSRDPNSSTPVKAFERYLEEAGVSFGTNVVLGRAWINSAEGTSDGPGRTALFFNERTGTVLVRATMEDLDIVEKAIQLLNLDPAPVVTVQIKFAEIEPGELKGLGLDGAADANTPGLPLTVTNWNGVISDPHAFASGTPIDRSIKGRPELLPGKARIIPAAQAEALLKKLPIDILSAPRITTLSGQQAQVALMELKSIYLPETLKDALKTLGHPAPTNTAAPIGLAVDVIPHVAADGRTVELTALPTWTEFLGYDDPGPFTPADDGEGRPISAQRPLPRFRVRKTTISAAIPVGQTLVTTALGESSTPYPKGGSRKQLLLLLTPTIEDAAAAREDQDPGHLHDKQR